MATSIYANTSDYRKLICYQKAEAIYDITYYFCKNYLRKGARTVDQVLQAAYSGKQNITEGSAASSTSKETEIKLKNEQRQVCNGSMAFCILILNYPLSSLRFHITFQSI
jgi:hypothetical protein